MSPTPTLWLKKGTAVFISHFYCPWTRAYMIGKGVPLASDLERGKGAYLFSLPRQQQPHFVTVVSSE